MNGKDGLKWNTIWTILGILVGVLTQGGVWVFGLGGIHTQIQTMSNDLATVKATMMPRKEYEELHKALKDDVDDLKKIHYGNK